MKQNVWKQINRAYIVWALLKTNLWYRVAFGRIGRGSIIQTPILLNNTHCVEIGDNVSIQQGARFDIITNRFGYSFQPKVLIGDSCSFEQNFHLACAQEIVIGRKVAVTENVGIFDIWHPYEAIDKPIVDQPLRTAPVRIGDETLIGMGAVIQPGVTIGKHCVIGANSVVTHNIPDYSVAVGAPARVIRQYDMFRKEWVATRSQ